MMNLPTTRTQVILNRKVGTLSPTSIKLTTPEHTITGWLAWSDFMNLTCAIWLHGRYLILKCYFRWGSAIPIMLKTVSIGICHRLGTTTIWWRYKGWSWSTTLRILGILVALPVEIPLKAWLWGRKLWNSCGADLNRDPL
jgi:hypothetical protein